MEVLDQAEKYGTERCLMDILALFANFLIHNFKKNQTNIKFRFPNDSLFIVVLAYTVKNMNKYRSVVLLISIKSFFFFFLKCDELEQMTTVLIHCPASHPEERKKTKRETEKKNPQTAMNVN